MLGHLETGLFRDYVELVESGRPIDRVMQFYADPSDPLRPPRWFDIRAQRLGDGFAAAWRDVTASRQAMEDLRWNEGLFRRLAEANVVGIGIGKPDGEVVYANDEMLRMMGYTRADMDQGRVRWSDALAPECMQEVEASLAQLHATGATSGYEREFLRPDGGRTRFIGAAAMMPAEQIHLSIALDVTGRRSAELALQQSHDKLERTLESISDGVLELDTQWPYTYFSETGARMIGLRVQDLIGGCVWDLFPEAEGTLFHEAYHRAVRTGKPVHFEEFYPEPLNKWLECHCYPHSAGLTVYFHDITQRRQSEEQLRRNHDTFHTHTDQIQSLRTLRRRCRLPAARDQPRRTQGVRRHRSADRSRFL